MNLDIAVERASLRDRDAAEQDADARLSTFLHGLSATSFLSVGALAIYTRTGDVLASHGSDLRADTAIAVGAASVAAFAWQARRSSGA